MAHVTHLHYQLSKNVITSRTDRQADKARPKPAARYYYYMYVKSRSGVG